MKEFIAVVSLGTQNQVLKYQDFDMLIEAENHTAKYGGYATKTPNGNISFCVGDSVNKTLIFDSVAFSDAQIMGKWESDIIKSDKKMPRYIEDIIDSMDAAQIMRLPTFIKQNHANKKALRASKP
jgi:hypothetical protein